MKTLIIFLTLSLNVFVARAVEEVRYPLVPKPAVLIAQEGEFIINAKTRIVKNDSSTELSKATDFLKTSLAVAGVDIRYASSGKKNVITFNFDDSINQEEGYKLEITKRHILIQYKTPRGAFMAVQTLRQLFPVQNQAVWKVESIAVPAVKIEDYPRFSYRGAMLDVARYYFPVDFIKKYINLLAFYKINTFHLHLNDDQGWRMESKKYPKLQEVGAWRKETLIGHRTDKPERFDGKPHGGYYTQKELKDLVNYAADRFITIIPEIDIPGHAQAILAAYPQFGCLDTTYEVSTKWGVHKDILCPKEETFSFLEDIYTEVMDIFPSKYIHIGGDEVPKDRWEQSEFCQNLIKKLNLKDEHGLQSYFIQRVEKFINSKGRSIIGWDEILDGGLAPNATVMSWRGEKGGITAAKQNHDAIMTPSAYTYINMYQTKERKGEPFSNGGFLPLKKVYSYNPVPSTLTPDEAKYILGTQSNLWTEYITNGKDAEFMAFPRLCALAEVGWTPLKQKNYKDFIERLDQNLKHLDEMGVNYAKFYQSEKLE